MRKRRRNLRDITRREFLEAAAGTGALLSLSPKLLADDDEHERRHKRDHDDDHRRRTWFLNLSHENFAGHAYYLLLGKRRYKLRELGRNDAGLEQARRSNRFLGGVPDFMITHALEGVQPPGPQVVLSYLVKDPDTTSGQWQMSGFFLLPPASSYDYAYQQMRKKAKHDHEGVEGTALLSAKRRKYGLPPVASLRDLLEEQVLLDTTDWATAMVNVHPELVSADPDSAAHIQTSYIKHLPATFELSEVLGGAGPATPQQGSSNNTNGWATLVPFTDETGQPLVNQTGRNAGLILYDPQWNQGLKKFVNAAMGPALRSAKDDTTLGADVTNSPPAVPAGTIWTRSDGVATIDQSPGVSGTRVGSDNSTYTLSNVNPYFGGYSCTASTAASGGATNVTLNFKNWYVRYLGLYIQFLNSDSVVPISSLPDGIAPTNAFITSNNELLIGSLTPEFTIYGIPVQASGFQFEFPFPTSVASSAKIFASGLGVGSHTAQDTEVLGIVMTSLFNLIIPPALLAVGLGTEIDIFVQKLAFPVALLVAREIALVVTDGSSAQVATVFWRSVVRGAVGPVLKAFLEKFVAFLAEYELIDSLEDAIPIVGEIVQAIGIAGTLVELAETTTETLSSPWSYVYDLVATYDLSLTLNPATNDPNGFPATAATYKVSAVFDNGTPHTQTLQMPGTGTQTLPPVVFLGVPLGGSVTLSVGFYTADNAMVGHGTTGAISNVPASSPTITITEVRLPINASTVYQHKQKTALDADGNHLWVCAPAPGVTAPNCAPAAGAICDYRGITYNGTLGNVGYGWTSYSTSPCTPNQIAQLDQLASIPGVNTGSDAQGGYASLPCAMIGSTKFVYDPLGRSTLNFYLDTTNNVNLLRQVTLNPTVFSDPRGNQAWGKFTLPADDLLIHPSGAIVTVNQALSRMESLSIPSTYLPDAQAAVSLVANLHGGLGSRPGLFSAPTAATVTADGVVLILESGNNRIHAVDVSGNPLPYFTGQAVPYFLTLTATGGNNTQYLDIASEFSGFIYVLSHSNGVYRLDIYPRDSTSGLPLSTTQGFNAAKVAVDYWRNVYSLNYEVLMANGALPANGVTEPSVSQWTPTTPPPCTAPEAGRRRKVAFALPGNKRLLRWSTWRS